MDVTGGDARVSTFEGGEKLEVSWAIVADEAELTEVSDVIVAFDPVTRQRAQVVKQELLDRFRRGGNSRAAHIVEAIPAVGGLLDPDHVDRLLVRVHAEMQRISEEFQHGRRVRDLLRPLLAACREVGVAQPLRVVDIGCGTGFVVRWLAAFADLGQDVELSGVDLNGALVAEARRLAAVEGLRVSFAAADAFALSERPTIWMSTGILHHFRGPGLVRFFASHEPTGADAFAHFDFQPSRWAAAGSWLFHAARMREPLARHDGVVSALRAHPGQVLLSAARSGAPGFACGIYSARLWRLPIPRAFHTLVGVRPALREAFLRQLGRRAQRLSMFA
jgi:SAM-dependent methyltransferase